MPGCPIRTVGELLQRLIQYPPTTPIGIVVAEPQDNRHENFPVVREFVLTTEELQRTEPGQEALYGTRWYDPRETYSPDQKKMGGKVETVVILGQKK